MAPDLRACATQGEVRGAEQLCRSQLERFQAALAEGRPLTVACTQEAPLFAQEAELAGFGAGLAFANIRETAGWSREGAQAGAKMAALLALAALEPPPTALVGLKSEGVTLVLGRDAVAVEVATRLAETLDLTVLLDGSEPVAPPRSAPFPVLRGRARSVTGWLGAFAVVVDGYAAPAPSSRGAYRWGTPRDGAASRADLVLDLTGGPALLHATRLGYLRARPDDAAAVERLVAAAAGLVGGFDKPRFVEFREALCAHSRNRRTGCTRCLEVCPTGAITPGKDSVALSAEICAGCGSCAAVCPTGAASYALPSPGFALSRLRTLVRGFAAAGGQDAVVLLHDEAQGEALLDALARHGEGLPARVLPLRVNEVTALDLATLAAALAWGAGGVRVLLPGKRPEGAEGVLRNLEFLRAALAGLGLDPERAGAVETDDPFALGEALWALPALRATGAAPFLALGSSREILRQAMAALRPEGAPAVVAMPALAPFGAALVRAEGCTLCLACTMACPTQAFSANPDRPQLSFLEEACVQCGLCVATCPEQVIALEPRLHFGAEASAPQVVKAEEPFPCARCGKGFGTRSSIEKVKARLAAHWMYADPARLAVLELCEDCRAVAATTGGLDPYAGPARPRPRTAEDL